MFNILHQFTIWKIYNNQQWLRVQFNLITGGPISKCPIYFEYLTVSVIITKYYQKILAVFVCCVSEFS